MLRTAFYLLFTCFSVAYCHAQKTENDRARDWIQQYRLGTLAATDSSFLSAAEKTLLKNLQTDRSAAALCSKSSQADCSIAATVPNGLKLEGVRLNNELVKLDWQTKTETDSRGFVLERRSFTDTLAFDSIAYAMGQGTSLGVSKYSYTDKNNLPVAAYYRVKEIQLDGTFFYSNTVMIWGVAPKLTVLVIPNPGTAGNTGFYISGTASATAVFTVINSAGAVLVKAPLTGLTGSTFMSLAPYHLSRGLYILTVSTERENTSRRFLIL